MLVRICGVEAKNVFLFVDGSIEHEKTKVASKTVVATSHNEYKGVL